MALGENFSLFHNDRQRPPLLLSGIKTTCLFEFDSFVPWQNECFESRRAVLASRPCQGPGLLVPFVASVPTNHLVCFHHLVVVDPPRRIEFP